MCSGVLVAVLWVGWVVVLIFVVGVLMLLFVVVVVGPAVLWLLQVRFIACCGGVDVLCGLWGVTKLVMLVLLLGFVFYFRLD